MQLLGGHAIFYDVKDSPLKAKGKETIHDTAMVRMKMFNFELIFKFKIIISIRLPFFNFF